MRRAFGVVVAVAVLLAAVGFALSGRWPYRRVVQSAPLAPPPLATVSDTLHQGEALGDLFQRHGIGALDLERVIGLLGIDPRRTKAGWVVRFGKRVADSVASKVTVRTAADQETQLSREAGDWSVERVPIRWTTRAVRLEGQVATSLYDALAAAHADADLTPEDRIELAWNLADVFAWQVDFTRDIQPEDRFVALFELAESDRGEREIGAILAGELEVGDRHYSAFRFTTPDGRNQFFDADGMSLRRAFLKAPVEFRRVASGFSRSRFHPILQIRRKHEGVDYSAAAGTPVLAAGDGTVLSAGWAGGYGQTVDLRHLNGITTRYAHLRAFATGIRAGARVSQGEVIGYVGSTGLSSAPHLHYEFRQNGAARNPATVDLGSGDPLPPQSVDSFRLVKSRLTSLLRPPAESPHPADRDQ